MWNWPITSYKTCICQTYNKRNLSFISFILSVAVKFVRVSPSQKLSAHSRNSLRQPPQPFLTAPVDSKISLATSTTISRCLSHALVAASNRHTNCHLLFIYFCSFFMILHIDFCSRPWVFLLFLKVSEFRKVPKIQYLRNIWNQNQIWDSENFGIETERKIWIKKKLEFFEEDLFRFDPSDLQP